MVMSQSTSHLHRRAGFGPTRMQWKQDHNDLSTLFHPQTQPLDVVAAPLTPTQRDDNTVGSPMPDTMKRSKVGIAQLNLAWFERLLSPAPLTEKMTLFWHDHFACRSFIPFLAQQQNNTLRRHALDKFGPLLKAVSKDPAMLLFLNNQQNRKDHPNENFAREVMELFTLGRGHYNEHDIREAARAFTGWGCNVGRGEYIFRTKWHDSGVKQFRGRRGHFNGDQILDLLLEDHQTARFLTEKLWRFFVSDEVVDQDMIAQLSRKLYHSHYDITQLLHDCFSSDWFYEARFTASRIKSPVELLAGILVQTEATFDQPESALFVQRALGQVLFLPPNVGGWPLGKGWIDSSSLTFRMMLPQWMLQNSQTDFDAKDDGDANNDTNAAKPTRLTCSVNWVAHTETFFQSSSREAFDALENFLLPRPLTEAQRTVARQRLGTPSDEVSFVKRCFIHLMSLPEYQLC